MRLKSVIKFNLSELKGSLAIFYMIIVLICILFTASYVSMSRNGINGSAGGIDLSSAVFLFVVGLNSYKKNYLFLSTNGITRKTQFLGFVFAIIPVAAVMALIDTLIARILAASINYQSMFEQVYGMAGVKTGFFLSPLADILWKLALYLFTVMLGYFITILYYRMSKMLKIVVSIGVPVLLLYFIPSVDMALNKGRLLKGTVDFIAMMAGLKSGNTLVAVAANIAMAAVLAGLAYLLARRTTVKE